MAPKKRRRDKKARVSRSVRQSKPKDKLVELCPIQKKKCMFCGRKEISEYLYGKLYQLNDVVVHYYCILFSTNAPQKGGDNDGIFGFLLKDIKLALNQANIKTCFYCNKKGANICCSNMNCRKTFHLPCGLKNGSMHQYDDKFNSLCKEHRIKQSVDPKALKSSTRVECCICTEKVMPKDSLTSIWAPCCKKLDGWFHRKCIQELAFNAAYFFKCPLCNNVENFKLAMLTLGIYIPSRDASWEFEPDAFAELLERHSTCNVDECVCPLPDERNSNADTGPWKIVICNTCGSNGTHVRCSFLKCDQKWMCKLCSSISGNVGTKRRHEQIKNDISNIHQDESSTINNIGSRQTNARRMSPRNMVRRSTRLNTNKKRKKNKSQSTIGSLVTSDGETMENESSTSCNMNPSQTITRASSRSNAIGKSTNLNTKMNALKNEPQIASDCIAISDDETVDNESLIPCNINPRNTKARGMSRNTIGESKSLNTNKERTIQEPQVDIDLDDNESTIIDSITQFAILDDETMKNESSIPCNMNSSKTKTRGMSRNKIGELTSLNTNMNSFKNEHQKTIDLDDDENSDDDESTIIDSNTQFAIPDDETMESKSSTYCYINPSQPNTRDMSRSNAIEESTSLNTNRNSLKNEPQKTIAYNVISDDETVNNESSAPCNMNPKQTKTRGMSRNKIGESTSLNTVKERTIQEPQIVIDLDDDGITIIDPITQFAIPDDETMESKSSTYCYINSSQPNTREMSRSNAIEESTSLNTNRNSLKNEPQKTIAYIVISDDETVNNVSSAPCHMNPKQTKTRGMSRNKIGESTSLNTVKERTIQEPQIVIDLDDENSDDDGITIIDPITQFAIPDDETMESNSSTYCFINSSQPNTRELSRSNAIEESTSLNTNRNSLKNEPQKTIAYIVISDDETVNNESSTPCNMNSSKTKTRGMSRNKIGECTSLNTVKERTIQEPQIVIDLDDENSDDDGITIIDPITQFAIPDDETMESNSSTYCFINSSQPNTRELSRSNAIEESTSLNTNRNSLKNEPQKTIAYIVISDDETVNNESSTPCYMNPKQTKTRWMSQSNGIGESTSLNTNKQRTIQEPQIVIDSDDDESVSIDSIMCIDIESSDYDMDVEALD